MPATNLDPLTKIIIEHATAMAAAIRAHVRDEVVAEIRAALDGRQPAPAPQAKLVVRVPAKASPAKPMKAAKAKRVVACIKPGCNKPAKGPRYHYLCAEHTTAPEKEWKAWQAASRKAKK